MWMFKTEESKDKNEMKLDRILTYRIFVENFVQFVQFLYLMLNQSGK